MKKTESELVIEQLAKNTVELLNDYWSRAESLAIGTDEIKIGVVHAITNKTGKPSVKSTISFGRRIKASVEHEIDGEQEVMGFAREEGLKGKALGQRGAARSLTNGE